MTGLERGEPRGLLERGAGLLEQLEDDPTPTLRWYRATRPALVLGRGQGDLAVTSTSGLPVVGRFTGGGAVLLDETVLSLDILLPAGHPLLSGDLGAVFIRVGRAWRTALQHLGVTDLTVYGGPLAARRQGDARERLLAAVCYATLGRGEVCADGRKLVGLAQRRRRQGALVQCGLLRRWRPRRLLETLGADPDDAEVEHAAVGLDDLLEDPPDDAEVMTAVQHALIADG